MDEKLIGAVARLLPPYAGVIAATAIFCRVVWFPAYIGEERIAFEQGRKDVAAWQQEKAKLTAGAAEILRRLELSEKRLRAAEAANAFQYGSPYPTGLTDIRLGEPASAIEKVYSPSQITKHEDGYYDVAIEHSAVRSLRFDLDTKKNIRNIWFRMKADDRAAMVDVFTAMFGTPRIEAKIPTWYLPNGVQLQVYFASYILSTYVTTGTTRAK